MYNGDKIREILRNKGITNRKLIDAMGWKSQNQLKQVIEGNPGADILERICDFLEIPIDTLFERTRFTLSVNSEKEKDYVDLIQQQKNTIDALHKLLETYQSKQ